MVKLPISREVQSDADKTYVLVAKLKVDGQEVSALVDTGSSYTFLIWKYWYEVTERKRCDEMVYRCYECNPGPCEVGPTTEVPFEDGAAVTMFERPGQLQLADASSTSFTFGLTSAYKYTPGYSTTHAGLGLGLKRKPRSSFDTFVDQLSSQKLIGSRDFSMYLTAGDHHTGQLILGGEDPRLYETPMSFLA
ncbi:hypothetical protein FOL47_009650 [Perkinsus chesapeaki]|uniref:Peptidase A1 domain-containing protein n=1 Tax=Perkinsus chesapeaki TaxID=330153 RepID=A0A7J6MRH2_PERCH|nr:hypothetical protein FOL47_009650 [Perkinsus chesapeaki]